MGGVGGYGDGGLPSSARGAEHAAPGPGGVPSARQSQAHAPGHPTPHPPSLVPLPLINPKLAGAQQQQQQHSHAHPHARQSLHAAALNEQVEAGGLSRAEARALAHQQRKVPTYRALAPAAR